MKGFLALMVFAVLGGCASFNQAPVSADWTHWTCDSQASVDWRYLGTSKNSVEVKLGGSDQVYRLKAEPGASGQLYSDGVLAFHSQGSEGLVYWVATNDLIGRACKAQ